MSAANDAMKALTEQWYNALTQGLGLDQAHFQLAQGATALGTTDDAIWNILDSIPPVSVNNYFNPAQHNSLSTTYGAVINNLVPQGEAGMQTLLKNKFLSWTKFANDPANLPKPMPKTASGGLDFVQAQKDQFQQWCLLNAIDTATMNNGITQIDQLDVISVAVASWRAANGVYAYTANQASLTQAVNQGQAKSVALDSATTSTDTTHSWAKVSASGLFDFFSAGGSGSWDKFTEELHSKGVDMKVEYASVAQVSGGPYAKEAPNNPDLADCVPWFNTAALKTAQANNNNKVWKHAAPTWDQTFGPNGNLKRLSTALIVVDGIKSTMTSKASVAKDSQESFKTAISGGFWPFFSISGEGGWEHDTTFNDDGTFTVTSECKKGNPTVLGVLVDDVDDVIGGA